MLNFKRHILFEAAQKGFDYEKNAAAALIPYGIVPAGFSPAGAGHDIPDLYIQKNGIRSGCELKITSTDAGSLVIKYQNGDWTIGKENETDDEKIFIQELAKEVGILDVIRQKWNEEPIKGGTSQKIKDEAAKLTKRERYERDLKTFRDIKGTISASKIEEYYNKKDTHYINVGTHGFYLLGKRNPLNLKNIPTFSSAAKATYRARCQYKSKDNYQFTFAMNFIIPAAKKSPFNIAPIVGLKDVTIDKKKLNISWFVEE